MRWLLLALLSACTSYEGVTVYGKLDGNFNNTPPAALSVAAVFSPEDADSGVVWTTVTGGFPAEFVLSVPGPSSAQLEDKGGFEEAAGELWIGEPNPGAGSDGVSGLVDLTRYVLIYLTDDPGTKPAFGVHDLDVGWNLIHAKQLTCADALPQPNGTTQWNFQYERLPLETYLDLELGALDPWDPPSCP
jgi:hypothetical protein